MRIHSFFDIDSWYEILSTLKRNKLRSFLTGFSVAWGIFIIIILLAAANGLKNAVTTNFDNTKENIITLYPGVTSMPYAGYTQNRFIELTKTDLELVINHLPNVTNATAVILQYNSTFNYKNEYANFHTYGVRPVYKLINNLSTLSVGRFLNEADEVNKRKVVVLDNKISATLFKTDNPIGKYVNINKIPFQVIGMLENVGGFRSIGYIPFSTASILQNPKNYDQISFLAEGLNTEEKNNIYTQNLRKQLAKIHSYSPEDKSGIYISNMMEGYIQTLKILSTLNIFIWIIGFSTLIAGIVGVGNIMLITVKERTREIGIRKALGAQNGSILSSIVLESVVITTIFGYVGILLGTGIMEFISFFMRQSSQSKNGAMQIFVNPSVDMGIVLSATLVLVISGALAGYIPARKAVKIKPIEALRYE